MIGLKKSLKPNPSALAVLDLWLDENPLNPLRFHRFLILGSHPSMLSTSWASCSILSTGHQEKVEAFELLSILAVTP
jgi:hypothetical protein